MVEEQLIARGIRDPQIVGAMSRIPRHEFVDPGLISQSYEDHPVSIGTRQTISQPYIVGLMTQSLNLTGSEKVLEIGTGSGYQTAILAEICRQVFSVERVASLSNRARGTLYRLGYVNVRFKIGDGTGGWPDEAPFDRILVTAAAPEVPKPYLEQLTEGGVLVLPRGGAITQDLVRITKGKGTFREENLGECRFVKLYGEHGWHEGHQ